MAINNFSLVNQRFAFAGSLLSSVSELGKSLSGAGKLHRDALLSSCMLQLAIAYHFYLREIADRAHLKNSALISSLKELESSLLESDRFSSDVAELLELVHQKESWLVQLERYSEEVLRSPAKEKIAKSFQSDDLIAVVDVMAIETRENLPLTLDSVAALLNAFRGMILRQRDAGAEF